MKPPRHAGGTLSLPYRPPVARGASAATGALGGSQTTPTNQRCQHERVVLEKAGGETEQRERGTGHDERGTVCPLPAGGDNGHRGVGLLPDTTFDVLTGAPTAKVATRQGHSPAGLVQGQRNRTKFCRRCPWRFHLSASFKECPNCGATLLL